MLVVLVLMVPRPPEMMITMVMGLVRKIGRWSQLKTSLMVVIQVAQPADFPEQMLVVLVLMVPPSPEMMITMVMGLVR